MERTVPETINEGIELYIRTYYSLLRSSGDIRIRSLEETHEGMLSSLHLHAEAADSDTSAFLYAALRLPDCIRLVRRVVLGQSEEVFRRGGLDVSSWQRVDAGTPPAHTIRWGGNSRCVRVERVRHRRSDPFTDCFSNRVEQATPAPGR